MKPALKVVVSSEYRIEKNIPVKRIVRGTIIYPFADMVKGDSFLVKTDGSHKAYRGASNSLHRQIRMFNARFSAEPSGEVGEAFENRQDLVRWRKRSH